MPTRAFSYPLYYLLVDWCILTVAMSLLDHGARLCDTEYCNARTFPDLGLFVVSCRFLAILVLLGLLSRYCACVTWAVALLLILYWHRFAARRWTNQLTRKVPAAAITLFPCLPSLWQTHRQTENRKVTIGPAGCAVRTWLVKMVLGPKCFCENFSLGRTIFQEFGFYPQILVSLLKNVYWHWHNVKCPPPPGTFYTSTEYLRVLVDEGRYTLAHVGFSNIHVLHVQLCTCTFKYKHSSCHFPALHVLKSQCTWCGGEVGEDGWIAALVPTSCCPVLVTVGPGEGGSSIFTDSSIFSLSGGSGGTSFLGESHVSPFAGDKEGRGESSAFTTYGAWSNHSPLTRHELNQSARSTTTVSGSVLIFRSCGTRDSLMLLPTRTCVVVSTRTLSALPPLISSCFLKICARALPRPCSSTRAWTPEKKLVQDMLPARALHTTLVVLSFPDVVCRSLSFPDGMQNRPLNQ